MQIDRLSKKLEGISDASKKGRRVKDLFRIMTNCRELWLAAYANIYSNKGAITEGVNANTLDGFSQERVERIIEKLRNRKYRFSPVSSVANTFVFEALSQVYMAKSSLQKVDRKNAGYGLRK